MPSPKIDPERQAIGSWLRGHREKIGLSLAEMAEATGTNKRFVINVELGRERIPTTSWSEWAGVLKQDDLKIFTTRLLQAYDPILHQLLFGTVGSEMPATYKRGSHKQKTDDVIKRRVEAGAWLSAKRLAAGLTPVSMAPCVGVPSSYIYEIEKGGNRLTIARYSLFAHALDCDFRTFALQMTKFYDPEVYSILFGAVSVDKALLTLPAKS